MTNFENREMGIAWVQIPIELLDNGLYDYLYQKSNGNVAFYLVELLKADKAKQDARDASTSE